MNQHHHSEDIGKILLQAQEDLRNLREQVGAQSDKPIDSNILNGIIARAEEDLKAKAKVVLNGVMNDSMRMLPVLPQASSHQYAPGHQTSQEPFDATAHILAPRTKKDIAHLRRKYNIPEEPRRHSNQRKAQYNNGRIIRLKTSSHLRKLPKMNRIDPSAPTPQVNQEDAKGGLLSLINRGFIKPGLDLTPALGHDDLMLKNQSMPMHPKTMAATQTRTFVSPSNFNLANLRFDLLSSDELDSDDHKNDGQSHNNVVDHKASRVESSKILQQSKAEPHPVMLRLDSDMPTTTGKKIRSSSRSTPTPKTLTAAAPVKEEKIVDEDGLNSIDVLKKNVDKIRNYNELLDTYSLHQFIIRKGLTLRTTPEFVSFQRTYTRSWGSITTIISKLEHLLTTFAIPLAYINGQNLVNLAMDDVDIVTVTRHDLFECILNGEEVQALIREPGRQYRGPESRTIAATVIQSVARMYLQLKKRHQNDERETSARTIQSSWRIVQTQRFFQRELYAQRLEREEIWAQEQSRFESNWDQIKIHRRVVVHIPSLSTSSRLDVENFTIRENLQLARVCAIADPLVDVVYVSPFPLTEDVKGYYMKLLELGGLANPESRIRIVTPESAEDFPDHFSLASVCLYSPHCLRRIRRYIRRKEAYAVMGIVGATEKRLAMELGIPILGLHPDLAVLYNTKSASKRVFMDAQVNVPLSVYEIYDVPDLMAVLSKLIVSHLDVKTWLIKTDQAEYDEMGIAEVDVSQLTSVANILKQKKQNEIHDPMYFQDEDVLRLARNSIQLELETSTQRLIVPVFRQRYRHWTDFATDVNRFGAVVEAQVEQIQGFFRSNIFIEPSGVVHVTSTQDRIPSSGGLKNHEFFGSSFPQSKVPHAACQGMSLTIGNVLAKRRVFGYLTLDFLSYLEQLPPGLTKNNEQQQPPLTRIMALDIKPYLTDSAIGFVLFSFLVGGQYFTRTGKYFSMHSLSSSPSSIELTREQKSSKKAEEEEKQNPHTPEERFYTIQEYIYHPNIATIPYNSFFNACRLDGICFDLQHQLGTAFVLSDSLSGGVLGILCIGRTSKDAHRWMHLSLDMIQRHVGSAKGKGNFDLVFSSVRGAYERVGGKLLKSQGRRK